MGRIGGKIYAIALLLLMAAGECLVVYFAWTKAGTGVAATAYAIGGFLLAIILASTVHELGHIVFAKAQGMRVVMTKFSFFSFWEENGKMRFSFVSPFASDQTQTIPLRGGNMKKRAELYTVGGLIFGGIYSAALLAGAFLVRSVSESAAFLFWGGVPYAAYLFFLNLPPFRYENGPTDTAVLQSIVREAPAGKCLISAMEIHGKLAEGKSFSEIDEKFYFDLPQLPEDEPMYAIILDLRYRYYLERGETERAADCLNRLASAQPYLSKSDFEQTAAELTYMHALNGDAERAEECAKLSREYLEREDATAKRILAAYASVKGEKGKALSLKERALGLLDKKGIEGVKRFEKILLERL